MWLTNSRRPNQQIDLYNLVMRENWVKLIAVVTFSLLGGVISPDSNTGLSGRQKLRQLLTNGEEGHP
jgi:hypothetical protein